MKKILLRECLRIAREKNDDHPEKYRHSTFVVQSNKIVEWGINRSGDPLTSRGYPKYGKVHSENDAYRKAKGLLSDKSWEAVNVRLSKSGELRQALPCPCCIAYLVDLGCKSVWATTPHGWAKVAL